VERIGQPSGGPYAWRRAGVALLFACCAIGLLAAAPAHASNLKQKPFQDRVIRASAAATKSGGAKALPRYPVAGGGSVAVQVDPAYAGGGALQRVLDSLGELPHGAEMNKLTVHIADLANLFRFCGQGATACYYPNDLTMVVSGDPVNQNNGMPQGMVIAHEYGHHIEANRSVPGWNASSLGGRHWATYEHVCEGVSAGRLFPGDQGTHYWDNPGEAFAQAYATMLYPGVVPWWWHFAEPNEGSFAAIRADVADGSPAATVRWSRTLAPGASTAATTITTSLDGPIEVRLRQPRSARFDVTLRSTDGRLLSRGRVKGGSKAPVSRLAYSSCGGARTFTLQVHRRTGKGKFQAKIRGRVGVTAVRGRASSR
jgi:hypothetical protein